MVWEKILIMAIGTAFGLIVYLYRNRSQRYGEHGGGGPGGGGFGGGGGRGPGGGGGQGGGGFRGSGGQGESTLRRRLVRKREGEAENEEEDIASVNDGTPETRETNLTDATEDSDVAETSSADASTDSDVTEEDEGPVSEITIEIWEFGGAAYLTIVPNNWTVSRCIRHIQALLNDDCDIDLWYKNRRIMLDKDMSINDYPGMVKCFLIRHSRTRVPNPANQTTEPDLIDSDEEDARVMMSCGHAITPDKLYNYTWNGINGINDRVIEVTCPAVPNNFQRCDKPWSFKEISLLACLSADEEILFLDILFSNCVEKQNNVNLCPRCGEAHISDCVNTGVFTCYYCEKDGHRGVFCVKCLESVNTNGCLNVECQRSVPILQDQLKGCGMLTIVDVPNCPSVRACPECQCVIEFYDEDMCKHMMCPRCQIKFCFICLNVKTDRHYGPCGGVFDKCKPAPRQTVEIA